jgi:hypothetical protein
MSKLYSTFANTRPTAATSLAPRDLEPLGYDLL